MGCITCIHILYSRFKPQTQIPANLPALEMIKYKNANFITTNALFCKMHIFRTHWGLPISNQGFYFSKLIKLKEYVPKELIECCAWVLITIWWRKNEKIYKKIK